MDLPQTQELVMADKFHLMGLIVLRANERERLRAATSPKEIELRTVWVAQLDKEIAAEEKFLGIEPVTDMSDDDLMKELES